MSKILHGESSLTAIAAETAIAKGTLSKWVSNARNRAAPDQKPPALRKEPDAATLADLQAKIARLEASVETLRGIVATSFSAGTALRFSGGG